MKKLKNTNKLWGTKTGKGIDPSAEYFSESISFDYRLYEQDIEGSIAHVEMLARCKLISSSDRKKIIRALNSVRREISSQVLKGSFKAIASYEDIHTYIERQVTRKVGAAVGSKIHTARSRNDQVATDMRLYIRKDSNELLTLLDGICSTITNLTDKNKTAVMPAYTHMQIAKPVAFRKYFSAYTEMFKRDIKRIQDCQKRLNYCPLGSGAVGGVHYAHIDRLFTAKKLHFSGPIPNTVDAVSDRDFIMEYLFCLSLCMTHISRLSEDLIIWASPQFGFIILDSSFTTGSSILPQKRNPDICELARGKTGRVYGNLMGLLTVMKGLPLSYNRDMQEDKELLFDSSDTVKATLHVYIRMLSTMKINRKRMVEALTGKGFAMAPVLVDTLAERGFSFRKAHEFVSRLVDYCDRNSMNFTDFTKFHAAIFLRKERGISKESITYLKKVLKGKNIEENLSRYVMRIGSALVP